MFQDPFLFFKQDSVAEGGVMREYMQLAELVCLLGPTLFVHGQLIGNFHHGDWTQFFWGGKDDGGCGSWGIHGSMVAWNQTQLIWFLKLRRQDLAYGHKEWVSKMNPTTTSW